MFYKTIPIFIVNCIVGIIVYEGVKKHYMERSVGIVATLNPVLGYGKSTELAKDTLETNKGILALNR